MAKAQFDQQKLEQDGQLEVAKLGVRVAETNTKEELEAARIASHTQVDGAKIGIDIAKQMTDK